MTHLTLLLAYSLAQIALGLWIARHVRSTSDFFVAGRRLGPGLLLATFLAANIGAGSTVGAAGLGYRDGLSAWWWVGSAGIGSFVLAMWVGPRIRRLAVEHDFRTVGDFLEWRYGERVRAGRRRAALVQHARRFSPRNSLRSRRSSTWSRACRKYVGCVLGGIVITTYFMAGGLLSSVGVNVVQLTVKFVGFGVALPLALVRGGRLRRAARGTARHPSSGISLGRRLGLDLRRDAGAGVCGVAGPDSKGVRRARRSRRSHRRRAQRACCSWHLPSCRRCSAWSRACFIPTCQIASSRCRCCFTTNLPPAVGTLGLAAVFSAELSAADAILFMLATSLSKDLYKRFLNPAADDRRVLVVARGAAVAGGVLGVALAIVAETIIGSLTVFYTLMTVILFVPLLGGLYTRRLGTTEALAAIGAGVSALVVLQLWNDGAGRRYVPAADHRSGRGRRWRVRWL